VFFLVGSDETAEFRRDPPDHCFAKSLPTVTSLKRSVPRIFLEPECRSTDGTNPGRGQRAIPTNFGVRVEWNVPGEQDDARLRHNGLISGEQISGILAVYE
jgi:hypothetical protein